MNINDDQQFLNDALRQATESNDPQAEIGLVLLRYHQAMLNAVLDIKHCDACLAVIDLGQLQATARQIQQSNYADYQELQSIVKARLGDTAKLCNECQRQYKASLLQFFAQMHTAS